MLAIGHLNLTLLSRQAQDIAADLDSNTEAYRLKANQHADRFCATTLDTEEVDHLYISDCQEWDLTHGMIATICPICHDTIDAVVGGVYIEHVFNCPIAIESCVPVLKKDEYLFLLIMVDNRIGCGCYQFRPEPFLITDSIVVKLS